MSRPLRIEYPGAWYHVMNRGMARMNIFETDDHRQTFIGLFADIHQRFGIEIHAYCLMDNHYHLLVHTPRGNLSRGMRHLNGLFTQYMNRALKRDGPLLRGRYKSILVQDNAYLLHVSRYIHDNPVGPGLASRPQDYAWSSCRHYIQGDRPVTGLKTDFLLQLLSNGNEKQQRQRYAAFMHNNHPTEIKTFYDKQRLKPVLGDENFVEQIKAGLSPSAEQPDYQLMHEPLSIDRILQSTASLLDLSIPEWLALAKHDAKARHYRALAMAVCQQQGHKLSDIAAAVGLRHYSAVSSAIRRVDKGDEENAVIMKAIVTRDEI